MRPNWGSTDRLIDLGEETKCLQSVGNWKVCVKCKQTAQSCSGSWPASRFVQVASLDNWKLEALQKSAVSVNVIYAYSRTKEKRESLNGHTGSLPNHHWTRFAFLFCVTRIAVLAVEWPAVQAPMETKKRSVQWCCKGCNEAEPSGFFFLNLKKNPFFCQSRKGVRQWKHETLNTFRASITRSRASSSPSRMLKSINNSGFVRFSILNLD